MSTNGVARQAGWGFSLAWVGLNAVANIGSFFIYSFTLGFLNATFPQLFNTVIVNVIGGIIALLLFGFATGTIQRYYFAKAFSRQPKRWLLNNILAWEISGVYIILGS